MRILIRSSIFDGLQKRKNYFRLNIRLTHRPKLYQPPKRRRTERQQY